MIGRNRASQLAGVSACALGAAVVLMSGEAAAACTATFWKTVGDCHLPPEGVEEPASGPFSTSFTGGDFAMTGDGADQLIRQRRQQLSLDEGEPTRYQEWRRDVP